MRSDWDYWGPIAYGLVKFTLEEWDQVTPLFVAQLKAAQVIRAELDEKARKAVEKKNKTKT